MDFLSHNIVPEMYYSINIYHINGGMSGNRIHIKALKDLKRENYWLCSDFWESVKEWLLGLGSAISIL